MEAACLRAAPGSWLNPLTALVKLGEVFDVFIRMYQKVCMILRLFCCHLMRPRCHLIGSTASLYLHHRGNCSNKRAASVVATFCFTPLAALPSPPAAAGFLSSMQRCCVLSLIWHHGVASFGTAMVADTVHHPAASIIKRETTEPADPRSCLN